MGSIEEWKETSISHLWSYKAEKNHGNFRFLLHFRLNELKRHTQSILFNSNRTHVLLHVCTAACYHKLVPIILKLV